MAEGKTQWIHSACSENTTYLTAHEKRGVARTEANGILANLKEGAIAVHDCWKPYWPPKKGRKKKGYILALIKRLSDYKDEILLFASDFSIPFTNNLAEQSIRHVKVKTKNAGCFRSMQGATAYLKIQSFLDTVRKQGENTFSALAAVFTGDFRFGIGF